MKSIFLVKIISSLVTLACVKLTNPNWHTLYRNWELIAGSLAGPQAPLPIEPSCQASSVVQTSHCFAGFLSGYSIIESGY